MSPPYPDIVSRVLALAPEHARELRVVRHRVRASAGRAISEWLGDAVLGGDGGPSDGPRPLRVASVQWVDAAGETVAVEVGTDEIVQPDDVARLMHDARRRNIPLAVWSETDRRPTGVMELDESWFARSVPVSPAAPVECRATRDGAVVTVDERISRQPWWLLMYVALIASFAWIFFLFVGGLPKIMREIWHRAVTGIGQVAVFDLGADALRVQVTGGLSDLDVRVEREHLVALGTTFGLTAYLADEAVPLPVSWATADAKQKSALTMSVAACLNSALEAN